MSTGSNIEWTDATWTPVKGCTRASEGCDHCYAVTMTHRLEKIGQPKYAGLTVLNNRGERHFNGQVVCDADALAVPLRWKKPRKVFVSSMSDIFHKDVPFEFLDRIFAVMALCPQHTFQVLTKRPERMAEYLASRDRSTGDHREKVWNAKVRMQGKPVTPMDWPLPNVWLGTSVESQRWADERIPHLLKCPAAVRFLSMEPLLGAVDLTTLKLSPKREYVGKDPTIGNKPVATIAPIHGHAVKANVLASEVTTESGVVFKGGRRIDWVIVGGESGPKARPCDVAWIRSIVQQCKAAGVPCFVKQLGARVSGQIIHPDNEGYGVHGVRLEDKKGGDMAEWPEDLRVREMPGVPS